MPNDLANAPAIDRLAAAIEANVIAWRRDIHAHPELGNREVRTGKKIAEHLRRLGIAVTENVAYTGVVGVLKGGKPGPCVGLRADIDALPVSEETDVPFASRERTTYNGQEVGVMHACGHDVHTSILMGVAEIFAQMKEDLPGTVKFIFQPSEEGPPEGEEGGAQLMIKEGVLDNPKVDAIFGLHVVSILEVGKIGWRAGPFMASTDDLRITLRGKQTHGAMPWYGVDPIVMSAQVILGLQTIASRRVDVTRAPSIITIGSIHGGVRQNIIPDCVELTGTIRTFDEDMRAHITRCVCHGVKLIAQSAGGDAEINIAGKYPVTVNHEDLTHKSVPTLERVAGKQNVLMLQPVTGAEDFSFFQQNVPGVFFFIGGAPKGQLAQAYANHSPRFYVDESGILTGLRALAHVAFDYLSGTIKL